jgi:hypothetical protein
MGRTDYNLSGLPGVVDPHNTPRDNGHQIDWDNVDDAYKNDDGKKLLPALTAIGTLLGSGKISPRVADTNPAVALLATTAVEGDESAAATGYGVFLGGIFYENLLPDATGSPKTLPADIKAELAEAGTGWAWRTYSDDRA